MVITFQKEELRSMTPEEIFLLISLNLTSFSSWSINIITNIYLFHVSTTQLLIFIINNIKKVLIAIAEIYIWRWMGILERVEYSRLLLRDKVNINIDVNLVRVWVRKRYK